RPRRDGVLGAGGDRRQARHSDKRAAHGADPPTGDRRGHARDERARVGGTSEALASQHESPLYVGLHRQGHCPSRGARPRHGVSVEAVHAGGTGAQGARGARLAAWTARSLSVATILVIDDERMVCDLLRAVLSRYGHEVLTAFDGRNGLALFEQHRPRFTLLDLHMPGMNGIEVLTRIHALDPRAAVIVLTGAGSADLENQARQMGVTDFLSKGLSLEVLVGTMERGMQQPVKSPPPPSQSAVAPKASSPSQDAGSILVVDDEPQI